MMTAVIVSLSRKEFNGPPASYTDSIYTLSGVFLEVDMISKRRSATRYRTTGIATVVKLFRKYVDIKKASTEKITEEREIWVIKRSRYKTG